MINVKTNKLYTYITDFLKKYFAEIKFALIKIFSCTKKHKFYAESKFMGSKNNKIDELVQCIVGEIAVLVDLLTCV